MCLERNLKLSAFNPPFLKANFYRFKTAKRAFFANFLKTFRVQNNLLLSYLIETKFEFENFWTNLIFIETNFEV